MAMIDAQLALLALSVVPALGICVFFFSRPLDRTTERLWARQGSLMALLEQSLFGIRAVQGFAREAYVQLKLEDRAGELADAYNDVNRVGAAYKEAAAAVTGVGAAAVLGLGGMRVIDGRLSVGDLLVFVGYLTALYAPVNNLSLAVGYAIQVVARGRRVLEVLDSTEEVPERPNAVPLRRAQGEVVFDGVTFGYDRRRPVVRDITFTAVPGQITAIVGATGAGKTSLVSLLSGFYDPWLGQVLLDGRDVRDLVLRDLRESVSLVLQEPFLFPMSIADNIGFGRANAGRAEIVDAAKAAQAHRFIEALPDGYDTVVSEKGASLSGGERQRIAIARAILKDAPILVLDEPTSAVDARTEEHVFRALSNLIGNKTTFVISHRLSTIRRADQILTLEGAASWSVAPTIPCSTAMTSTRVSTETRIWPRSSSAAA